MQIETLFARPGFRRISFSAFALVSIAACGTSASTPRETVGAKTNALLGAPVDPNHTFSVGVCGSGVINADADAGAVGACLTAGTRCTGTLIAPNLVLTARHCLGEAVYADNATGFCDATFPADPTTAKITLSDSVLSGPPVWLDVAEQIFPANQTPHTTSEFCDDDLAILVLAKNVPASAATPIDVDVDTDIAVHHPSAIAIVGRGVVASVLQLDASSPDYQTETDDQGGLARRVLENIPFQCANDVVGPDGGTPCTVVDYSSPPSNLFTLPFSYAAIGFGTASGDSGSGYLDQASFTAGKPKLVAVNSAGTYGSDGVPNYGLGVRVSLHKELLVSAAQHAATVGGYPLPVWAGGTAAGSDSGTGDDGGSASDAGAVDSDGGAAASGGSGDADSSSSCAMSPGPSSSGAAFFVGLGLALAAVTRRRRTN